MHIIEVDNRFCHFVNETTANTIGPFRITVLLTGNVQLHDIHMVFVCPYSVASLTREVQVTSRPTVLRRWHSVKSVSIQHSS